jgi:hypothetical protein
MPVASLISSANLANMTFTPVRSEANPPQRILQILVKFGG